MYVTLPAISFKENHWHVTTNLVVNIQRHYSNTVVELKDGTLSVLPLIDTTKLNSFDKFSWLYCVHMCHIYSSSLTLTGMSV